MRMPGQIEKFRSRSPETVQTAVRKRRKLGVNADKLLGMRIRQRLKEYGVHYREYPGRGSDPEPHRIHWIPPPGNDTFETCFMFPVTEDSRLFQACFGIPLAALLCLQKTAAAW